MMSDEELVQRCVKKEPQAQEYLYKTFSSRMLGVCSRYTDSIEEAEDIMQEGLSRSFKNWKPSSTMVPGRMDEKNHDQHSS